MVRFLTAALLIAAATSANALEAINSGRSRAEGLPPLRSRGGSSAPHSSQHAAYVGPSEEIVFSQVIHRHGARTPLPPANYSILCPSGCGLLTDNGRDMLTKLGQLLKQRYAAQGYFKGDDYNPDEVYTRSTGVDRTVQSAASLLRGIYPNIDAYYPEIYAAWNPHDTLLQYDDYAGMSMYASYTSVARYEKLTPLREKLFPDVAIIQQMADELSLGGYCASATSPNWCLVSLYDTAACLEAQGTLPNYPTVLAQKDNINTLYREYVRMIFAYNATSSLDAARGSIGQPSAQAMLANMQSYVKGTMAHRFVEYSGHDTTLAPWCATVGAYGETLPVFGQAYIIDLIKDGSGTYYVRGTRGSPELTPGAHTYTTAPLQLGGINAKGTVYFINTTEARMPLEDFTRFVDSTKGTSGKGFCYVPKDAYDHYGLNLVNVPCKAGACTTYRLNCPQYACPSDAKLDSATLICKK